MIQARTVRPGAVFADIVRTLEQPHLQWRLAPVVGAPDDLHAVALQVIRQDFLGDVLRRVIPHGRQHAADRRGRVGGACACTGQGDHAGLFQLGVGVPSVAVKREVASARRFSNHEHDDGLVARRGGSVEMQRRQRLLSAIRVGTVLQMAGRVGNVSPWQHQPAQVLGLFVEPQPGGGTRVHQGASENAADDEHAEASGPAGGDDRRPDDHPSGKDTQQEHVDDQLGMEEIQGFLAVGVEDVAHHRLVEDDVVRVDGIQRDSIADEQRDADGFHRPDGRQRCGDQQRRHQDQLYAGEHQQVPHSRPRRGVGTGNGEAIQRPPEQKQVDEGKCRDECRVPTEGKMGADAGHACSVTPRPWSVSAPRPAHRRTSTAS